MWKKKEKKKEVKERKGKKEKYVEENALTRCEKNNQSRLSEK